MRTLWVLNAVGTGKKKYICEEIGIGGLGRDATYVRGHVSPACRIEEREVL